MEDKCGETFVSGICKLRVDGLTEMVQRHGKESEQRYAEIAKGIKTIHEKLFVGNGGKPMDVRLELIEDKTASLFGRWKYLMGIIAVLTASTLVKLVWEMIKTVGE